MATRFRKIGVTTLGACAGLGLAGWALNPFDRQYAVRLIKFYYFIAQCTIKIHWLLLLSMIRMLMRPL